MNAQAMTTVNYGTGYTNEAAAWVAYCNAATTNTQSLGVDSTGFNWQTAGYWASLRAAAPLGTDDGKNFLRISRTAPLGFKYWEIGNEEYGSWETDSNSLPHDPYTYAVRAAGYIRLMKAVDPTIKIGVVVTPGEDSYANGYSSHPAYNAREGTYHNGWTAVLLATLTSLGVTPDFLIHHRYPQNPGGESDAGLLASSTGWASDAANLRQMITDYVGSTGTNIELVCTENNSVSSSSRQTIRKPRQRSVQGGQHGPTDADGVQRAFLVGFAQWPGNRRQHEFLALWLARVWRLRNCGQRIFRTCIRPITRRN